MLKWLAGCLRRVLPHAHEERLRNNVVSAATGTFKMLGICIFETCYVFNFEKIGFVSKAPTVTAF